MPEFKMTFTHHPGSPAYSVCFNSHSNVVITQMPPKEVTGQLTDKLTGRIVTITVNLDEHQEAAAFQTLMKGLTGNVVVEVAENWYCQHTARDNHRRQHIPIPTFTVKTTGYEKPFYKGYVTGPKLSLDFVKIPIYSPFIGYALVPEPESSENMEKQLLQMPFVEQTEAVEVTPQEVPHQVISAMLSSISKVPTSSQRGDKCLRTPTQWGSHRHSPYTLSPSPLLHAVHERARMPKFLTDRPSNTPNDWHKPDLKNSQQTSPESSDKSANDA